MTPTVAGTTRKMVTYWFVGCRFEASSLDFGRCHLGFLEPEVTIFGREGGAELGLAWLTVILIGMLILG